MPTPLRFFLFFLVLVTVLVAVNRHVFRWVVDAFDPPLWAKKTLAWVMGVSLFAMFAGRIVDHLIWPGAPVASMLAVASAVQLSVLLGSIFLLAIDFFMFGVNARTSLPRWLARWRRTPPALPMPGLSTHVDIVTAGDAQLEKASEAAAVPARAVSLPRRNFLAQASAGSALLVSSSSSFYGALSGRHDYEIEEIAIRIPGLSPRFDGFTIAQLSDVHIGQFVGGPELAAAEDLIRRVKADLIVMTGDLVDHDVQRADELGRFVSRLTPLARHGVAAVTGNHDFYAGADEIVAAIRKGGGRALCNQGLVLGEPGAGIALLGVNDLFGTREGQGPNLQAAIASLSQPGERVVPNLDLPRVLLCHQPIFFERAAEHVALQMSGHTHGGQVNLLVRPADWVLPNGWVAGAYEHMGSTLYINRGFGTAGPPARIGAAPEVTRLVLTT